MIVIIGEMNGSTLCAMSWRRREGLGSGAQGVGRCSVSRRDLATSIRGREVRGSAAMIIMDMVVFLFCFITITCILMNT
uniref:Uncharacterized protein n=1 Tax=Anguilla anguilla TaxID=7936 RepID=A0A0E9QXD8_ANGAN